MQYIESNIYACRKKECHISSALHASKASAPYWNSGSATLASSAGFTLSTLAMPSVSRSALSVRYCFTSAASCSVFSMAASAQFKILDNSFFFARIGYFISSVFENFFSPYSFSGLSAKVRNVLAIFCPASLMPVPKASIFPMLLSTSAMDFYTFWRIFSNFFLIPRNSTTLFKATFPCSQPLSYCSCGADQSVP